MNCVSSNGGEMTGYDDYRDEDAQDDTAPLKLPEGYDSLKAELNKWTVRRISEGISDGTIVLQPDFQREYVWNSERASRYVESLLLGFPTPPIFLAQEQNGEWVVIDGHQRLETLFRYMKPLVRGDLPVSVRTQPELRLNLLEVLQDLNGSVITDLPIPKREQLWETELQVVLLPKEVASDLKYALFARLNAGSMSLNPQELRNCIFRGNYNDFIKRKSEESVFLKLWNPSRPEPDKRMKHRERLLRFYAMLHRRSQYRTPFRVFLNDEMEDHRHLGESERDRFSYELDTATKWMQRIFGREAFFRFEMGNSDNPQGKWVRNRLDVLADVEMVWFAEVGDKLDELWDNLDEEDREFFVKSLRHTAINVMLQRGFQEALSKDRTRASSLDERFSSWYRGMNSFINRPEDEVAEMKDIYSQLRNSEICARCPNRMEMEDAIRVGTEGLAHRYCQRYPRRRGG